jgi:hypothetical protein
MQRPTEDLVENFRPVPTNFEVEALEPCFVPALFFSFQPSISAA